MERSAGAGDGGMHTPPPRVFNASHEEALSIEASTS